MVNLVECLVMATSAAAAVSEGDTNDLAVYADAPADHSSDPLLLSSFDTVDPTTNTSSSPDTVSQCLSTWLIKTHTHFHGSDDLHLPWYFGLLCWSYAIGGVMMFVVEPRWAKDSQFPYRTMAWMLILLQSPLSFAADYLSMTDDTYIHTVDRLLACPMMAFEVCKALTMLPHVRWGTWKLYITSVVFAIYSFLQSSQAQEHVDAQSFIFWHNCWHVYPLLVSVIMGYDYFILGEFDREAIAAPREVGKTRRPLSAVVMEQAAAAAATPSRRTRAAVSSSTTPLRRSTRLRLRANAHAVTASS